MSGGGGSGGVFGKEKKGNAMNDGRSRAGEVFFSYPYPADAMEGTDVGTIIRK